MLGKKNLVFYFIYFLTDSKITLLYMPGTIPSVINIKSIYEVIRTPFFFK